MVDPAELDVEQEVVVALRERGARFGFVFGSQARGDQRPDSDLDVAAWWPGDPPGSYEVPLPTGVDLLVRNTAPLELAGRVAVEGRLLFDDDQVARVRWIANDAEDLLRRTAPAYASPSRVRGESAPWSMRFEFSACCGRRRTT